MKLIKCELIESCEKHTHEFREQFCFNEFKDVCGLRLILLLRGDGNE